MGVVRHCLVMFIISKTPLFIFLKKKKCNWRAKIAFTGEVDRKL